MLKYKAEWIDTPKIIRVEVIKETPTQVVTQIRREAKMAERYFYGGTYEDARMWLLDKCLKRKTDAEEMIERQNFNIKIANEMFDKISKFKEE